MHRVHCSLTTNRQTDLTWPRKGPCAGNRQYPENTPTGIYLPRIPFGSRSNADLITAKRATAARLPAYGPARPDSVEPNGTDGAPALTHLT